MDEINQLFGRLRSGPFSFMSADPSAIVYETQSPGIFPQGFLDEFDRQIGSYGLTAGFNSNFGAPPRDASLPINGTTNVMPSWSIATTGSAIVPTYVASGPYVVMTMTAGATPNTCYLEAYVPLPINAAGTTAVIGETAIELISHTGGGVNIDAEIRTQFYKADKTTTTGTEGIDFIALSNPAAKYSLTAIPNSGVTPTDAAWIRLRVGLAQYDVVAANAVIRIYNARPVFGTPTAVIGDTSGDGTGGLYQRRSSYLEIRPILVDTGFTFLDLSETPTDSYGVILSSVKGINLLTQGAFTVDVNGIPIGQIPLSIPNANNGDYLARIKESADTQYRLIVGLDSSGRAQFLLGSGAAAGDIKLYRSGSGSLNIENVNTGVTNFNFVAPTAVNSNDVGFYVTGDTTDRISMFISNTGKPAFRMGSGSALDIKMERSAAKTLTIDDNAGGNLTLFDIKGTLKFAGLDIIAAKGDLIAGTANDAASVLTVGGNKSILVADSTQATGLKWLAETAVTPSAVGTVGAIGTSGHPPALDDHTHAHEAAHINHDTTWAAKGDLIVGSANDTATVLTAGADYSYPQYLASAGNGMQAGPREHSIVLASDQTRTANTSTYADITGLTLALPSGLTVLHFVFEGWYQSNTATCGINLSINLGGSTSQRYLRRIMTTSPSTYDEQNLINLDAGTATTAVDTINTDRYFYMSGKIVAPTGTLAMRYANEVAVAGNSVKIMAGSTLKIWMV